MLRRLNEIIGYDIISRNGDIGEVNDFLFDDYNWQVRYMVADTGDWLTDRKVLLSPASLGKAIYEDKEFRVNLDREQIERSPLIDIRERNISRQYENDLSGYYGWPQYWSGDRGGYAGYYDDYKPRYHNGGTVFGGSENYGMQPGAGTQNDHTGLQRQQMEGIESKLRSVDEITGYAIRATDVEFGKVDDFIADDENWTIRYMLIDTHKWMPGGKHVIITPHWIENINWDNSEVIVNLTEDQIKNSPEFDFDKPVSREYENRLFEHYSRPKYWERKNY